MGFTEAVQTCFRRYVGFSGRAARPEYWWFVLFIFLVAMVTAILDRVIFGGGRDASRPITGLFQLAVLLPALAAGWRRLQDAGKPGWLIFLPAIPGFGFSFVALGGAFGVGMMERAGGVSGSGVLFGGLGLIAFFLVVLAVLVLMIWWLTRPSEPRANKYGPQPQG